MNKKELNALIEEVSASPEALEAYVTAAEEAKTELAEATATVAELMEEVEGLKTAQDGAAKSGVKATLKYKGAEYNIVTPKFYHHADQKPNLVNLLESPSNAEIEIAIKAGNLVEKGE